MKIEVGRYYRTRDGRKVGPMRDDWDQHSKYVWHTNDGPCKLNLWDSNGLSYGGFRPDTDLIAEWTDTPEVGTLRDIGAQVGDVVSWLDKGVDVGDHHEVTGGEDTYGNLFGSPNMQLSGNYCVGMESQDYQFRIVSRASDAKPTGPVITEAVTTKRIVPGVYGKVCVSDLRIKYGEVGIFIGSRSDEYVYLKRAELIAASDILSQLIDAMPQE